MAIEDNLTMGDLEEGLKKRGIVRIVIVYAPAFSNDDGFKARPWRVRGEEGGSMPGAWSARGETLGEAIESFMLLVRRTHGD